MKVLQALLVVVLFCSQTNCHEEQPGAQGYVEGKFTFVSSQIAGTLEKLNVERGTSVNAGDVLFSLDLQPESIEVKQAEAELAAAQSNLADLLKGKRPTEIAAIMAKKRNIEAQLKLATLQLGRFRELYRKQVAEKGRLDAAEAAYESRQAELKEIIETVKTASLEAREDKIEVARAQVRAAEAMLQQKQWKLSQKIVKSPLTGIVFDTFYRNGEVVSENQPIVSLLAPENTYAIAYAHDAQLAQIKLGGTVWVHCEGHQAPIPAIVRFISPEAEYTPPVIFSNETRHKLTYRIEAHFPLANAKDMRPGQPITMVFANHVE